MPEMQQGDLKALPAAGAPAAAPGSNAHLVNSYDEVKQSLEKFTESLHQKAVQVTGWLAAVDKDSSARAKSLLAISIVDFVGFFVDFFGTNFAQAPGPTRIVIFLGG